jgi:WD40 repeat protein
MKKPLLFLLFTLSSILSYAQDGPIEKPYKKASGHNQDVIFMACGPDWKSVFTSSRDNTIKMWLPDSMTEVRAFKGHISAVQVVTLSYDMQYMLSGSDDGSVILWDVATGNLIQRVHNHTGAVTGVAFSPDAGEKYFYTAGEDGNIQTYERTLSSKFIGSIKAEGGGIQGMGIPAGSRNIIIACNDGKMREYDTKGALLRTFEGEHSEEIRQLVFSADGKYAATCADDKKIIVWDLKAGNIYKTLEGHEWKVFSVAFNPTTKYLTSCSIDGTIRLWDLDAGTQLKSWTTKKRKSFNAVTFTPDSKYVISAIQHMPPLNEDFYWWNTGLDINTTPPVFRPLAEEKPVMAPVVKPGTKPKGKK